MIDLTISFRVERNYGLLKGVTILGFFQFSKIYRPKTNGPIGLKFGRLIEGLQARGSTLGPLGPGVCLWWSGKVGGSAPGREATLGCFPLRLRGLRLCSKSKSTMGNPMRLSTKLYLL